MNTATYLSKDGKRLVYWDLDDGGLRYERARNHKDFRRVPRAHLRNDLRALAPDELTGWLVKRSWVLTDRFPKAERPADASGGLTDRELGALHHLANVAGRRAALACTPHAMVVQQHADALDDSSPVTAFWNVPEGVCGFAWVNVPGNTRFGRYLKKQGLAKPDSYLGGVTLWVHDFGQSYERKLAYASAYADTLSSAGVRGTAQGRLD